MAVLTSSNDPVDIEIGFPTIYKFAHANKWEEPVVTNPKLANLIYHSCNTAFVLELLFFIAAIISCFRVGAVLWMTVLVIAMISPLFIIPLYGIPILRDEFIRSYATGPPLIFIPDI